MASVIDPFSLRVARKYDALKFFAALLLLLSLLFLQWKFPQIREVMSYSQYGAVAHQVVVHRLAKTGAWLGSLGVLRGDLLEKIEGLEQQRLLMTARLNYLIDVEQENLELKALLGVQASFPHRAAKMAEVVQVSAGTQRQVVVINLGLAEGLKVGNAVVDGVGVVGQVVQVGALRSQVLLVTDPSIMVPVMSERNGLQSLVSGASDGLVLQTPRGYLSVNEGDVFYTSGLGGAFPRGVPVGRVVSVEQDRFLVSVRLLPLGGLRSLSRVLVLLSPSEDKESL